MKTKDTANAGRTAKLRKILSILCLVLLAIVAFRSWQRKTEAGNADIIGGADKPTVAVLLPDAEESSAGQAAGGTSGINAPVTVADVPDIPESPPAATVPADSQEQTATPAPSPLEQTGTQTATPAPSAPAASAKIAEDGLYTSREDVALYIHIYGHLPANFITKAEAKALGWGDRYGSVDDAAPGKSIGGDRFGNREGLLPKKKGRTYTECDIGTMGKKSRGARRIVFSNDGLVYYTGDHYETFELLYGSE